MGCLGKGQRLSCALHRGVGRAGALCVSPGCCEVVCVPLVGREGGGKEQGGRQLSSAGAIL